MFILNITSTIFHTLFLPLLPKATEVHRVKGAGFRWVAAAGSFSHEGGNVLGNKVTFPTGLFSL